MPIDRRRFTTLMAGVVGGSVLPPDAVRAAAPAPADPCRLPSAITALTPMTDGIVPITADERRARMEKARRLMREAGLGALLLEPGTSMEYFTGMTWGQSERPFVAVLPARGELAFICPGFEEARARERLQFTEDVRVWQEDESPYRLLVGILRDRGVTTGRVGVEERLRFFIMDGVRQAAPALQFVGAESVTAGCRMFKSAAELALMQRANDITLAAIGCGPFAAFVVPTFAAGGVRVTNQVPTAAPKVMVLGLTTLPLLLPSPGALPCLLLPNPDVVVWWPAFAYLDVALPAAVRPVTFWLQPVELAGSTLLTGAAHRVDAH